MRKVTVKYKILSLFLPLLIVHSATIAFAKGGQNDRADRAAWAIRANAVRQPASKSFTDQNKPAGPKTPEAQIRAVLDAQVAAWNAGKLEEFMEGYWRSPNLTFFSGGRKLSGWDATLERYQKTYQAQGKEMGKLAFSNLDIQVLGPDGAVVRGRFELTMSDGKKLGGLYTLIFRRFNREWKIIHDHTSSDQ
jgi:beta-aspartyl-peptidase (threonine type)